MLVAQWQDAVTRRDMAELFSFEDFKEVCEKKKYNSRDSPPDIIREGWFFGKSGHSTEAR